MRKQDANIDIYNWYIVIPTEVSNAVYNVDREPGQGKQSQDQGQRSCQLFLFLQVLLTLFLAPFAWFISKDSSDGAEDVAVKSGHHQQRYQGAENKVEVNQV